jgi:hypothetical protein
MTDKHLRSITRVLPIVLISLTVAVMSVGVRLLEAGGVLGYGVTAQIGRPHEILRKRRTIC